MSVAFADVTVPVDSSPTSKRGVDVAIDFARGGARLHFCSVVSPAGAIGGGSMGMPFDPTPLIEAIEDEAKAACDGAVAAARERGIVADGDVLTGEVVPEIRRFTSQTKSDVLVIGTHARSGAARIVFGSVAERLMQTSDVPVVVAHVDDVLASDGPIAVAVDGSPASRSALLRAIELAHAQRRSLALVHAVDGGFAAWRAAEPVLATAADTVRDAGINFEIVTLQGEAAPTIIAAAERLRCLLIVAGTRGHSGAKRLLLGSVAAALVERAHVPVMVVRAT